MKENPVSPTRPKYKFDNEAELLQYSLKTLVKAGLTVEQIEKLRLKSNEPGYIFNKEIVGQRRFATSELLAAGLSNAQIAQVFRSSKETVASDREHIRKVYTDSILQNADNWRAKLLREQDEIKQKALEAFEGSKRKTIRRIQERNGDEIVTTEEQSTAGDPSFLNVAKGCLEQQAKLIGLFDKRPDNNGEEKGYKAFLSNLSKEVRKISAAEKNASDRAGAIETTAEAELDDNGEPTGNSRPMLPAELDEGVDEG
jgi:hypothetical protein